MLKIKFSCFFFFAFSSQFSISNCTNLVPQLKDVQIKKPKIAQQVLKLHNLTYILSLSRDFFLFPFFNQTRKFSHLKLHWKLHNVELVLLSHHHIAFSLDIHSTQKINIEKKNYSKFRHHQQRSLVVQFVQINKNSVFHDLGFVLNYAKREENSIESRSSSGQAMQSCIHEIFRNLFEFY